MTQINARATNISIGNQFWKDHNNIHYHQQYFLSISKSCYSYNKLILSQESESLSLPCSFYFATTTAALQSNSERTLCVLKLIESYEPHTSHLNTLTVLLGGLN